MPLPRIAMIFGGRSVEHEVSVITAHQAIAALPTDRYEAVPIYIAKTGQWYTGEALRKLDNFRDLEGLLRQLEPVTFSIAVPQSGLLVQRAARRGLFGGSAQTAFEPLDVAFPLIHGSHGEDGTLQGLFELANLPYVGADLPASAIAINKVLTKVLLRHAGLPVLDDVAFSRARWAQAQAEVQAQIERRFGYPVFVKPARLGSSIGVARADDLAGLQLAIDVAATYDSQILVEPAQAEIVEINCAVLGDGAQAEASVCEQPISAGLLSYADKYMQGGKTQGMKGARRRIPAPLPDALTEQIRQTAVRTFMAVGAAGVARIDFLVKPEQGVFYVNEINTLPGSLSFYLWEASGLAFPALLQRLIELAQARHSDKQRNTYTFSSSLLSTNPFGAKA